MLKNQLINTSTGSHTFGISPDGQFFLYWKDNKFQAYDLDAATHAHARRRGHARASWTWSSIIPARSRRTASPATPADKKSVIVQHRYDLWRCRSTDRRRGT